MQMRQLIQHVFKSAADNNILLNAESLSRLYATEDKAGRLLPIVPVGEAVKFQPDHLAFRALCLGLEKQTGVDDEKSDIQRRYPEARPRSAGLMSSFEMTATRSAMSYSAATGNVTLVFKDRSGFFSSTLPADDLKQMIESRILQNMVELKTFQRFPDVLCNGKTRRIALHECTALQKTAALFSAATGKRLKNVLADVQMDIQMETFSGFDVNATGINLPAGFSTAGRVPETRAYIDQIGDTDVIKTLAGKRAMAMAFHLKYLN
jgi:hypothetical protein